MSNIIIAPGKYVQGKGELSKLGGYVEKLGSKPFILVSPSGMKRVKAVSYTHLTLPTIA